MPEGPEVRKYADALDAVLTGRTISLVEARTRDAQLWLKENDGRLVGRRVLRVVSHGKHLIGYIHGGFYFHSHLMMWGRWQTFAPARTGGGPGSLRGQPAWDGASDRVGVRADTTDGVVLPDKDRRERARIIVDGGAAILLSAPIFNLGKGDPYRQIENLGTLGPDVLPYKRRFNKREFLRRLLLPEHRELSIGAALLNQRILAGLGNYLRAEVLFHCRLNPWRKVGELSEEELNCLSRASPELSLRSYTLSATAPDEDRERMSAEPSLVYQPGREYGTRHLVFRRTNLPCLRCAEPIKQLRQATYNSGEKEGEEERTRIVYFCAQCQNVRE